MNETTTYTRREFALQPLRPPIGPSLMMGLLAGFLTTNIAGAALHTHGALPAVIGLVTALVTATLSARAMRLQVPDRVRLGSDVFELVRDDRPVKVVQLAKLGEVNQLELEDDRVLLLADDRQTVVLPASQLAHPRAWEELSQALVETMARIDPTGARSRNAVQAGRLRELIGRRTVRGTILLAAIVGIASGLAFGALGAVSDRPFPLETLGALSVPLVLAGEPWRLLSHVFVHPTPDALLLVLAGLLWLGSWLEKLAGWERVVLAFVVGAVASGCAYVALGQPVVYTGAAGGVFGLLGAFLATTLVARNRLPHALLPRTSFWLLTAFYAFLLIGTALPWPATPSMYAAAMLARGVAFGVGFVTGLVTTINHTLPIDGEGRRELRAFAILACVALGIGIVGAATHARRDHPNDDEHVGRALLALPKTPESAFIQNNVAFTMLAQADAGPGSVSMATRLAERAVELSNRKEASILDTLAVARFRQGDASNARALLEEALRTIPGQSDEEKALRKTLERRLKDVDAGGPLSVE